MGRALGLIHLCKDCPAHPRVVAVVGLVSDSDSIGELVYPCQRCDTLTAELDSEHVISQVDTLAVLTAVRAANVPYEPKH